MTHPVESLARTVAEAAHEGQVECPGCGGTGDDDMDPQMYCPLCDGATVVDARTAAAVETSAECTKARKALEGER